MEQKTAAGDDRYLSVKALADYASLSSRKIRALLKDPLRPIPCRLVGAKILVRRSEFDLWMDRHRPGPAVDDVLAQIRGARRRNRQLQEPPVISARMAKSGEAYVEVRGQHSTGPGGPARQGINGA